MGKFEALSNRKLYPAQPEMFVIETMAYALSNVASAVQAGLLQNRAIWAERSHLDELAANVGIYRLAAQTARATAQFTLSEIRATGTVIPLGTRVSAGSELIFRTEAELIIPAGDMQGTVDIVATAPGAKFNDLLPGQIEDILDPVAYVSAVANTTVSAGGADVEADARLRLRVLNAFELIARGGSRADYIERTMAAHPDIVAVDVTRPQPGYIHITPLMSDGVAADVIDVAIIDHLNAWPGNVMGDYVTIHKAVPQVFDVTMSLKVQPGMAALALPAADTAIRARFAKWGQELGAQIAPSALVEAARSAPGVVGVDGPGFAFIDLPGTSFAQLGTVTLNAVEVPNV